MAQDSHEPLRYAHEEGHTDVCFSSDGSKFITCGSDGDIRIWSFSDSEDPIHNCVGEWANCVRQKDDSIYISTGSNDIQILTYPEGERHGVLDRFTAPINHIAVSGEYVALAGEDMEVKLIKLDPSGKDVTVFDGILGPILSVALNSKYLAASAGDGKLRVWSIETKSLLNEILCFDKVNSFANAKVLCRVDFQPDGTLLAYPDKENVTLLNTNDWSLQSTLTCDVTAFYTIVQFSPCGKYLAAASTEGDFVIWDVSSRLKCSSSKHVKSISICGMMWNPSGNGQIVYTDAEGQIGMMTYSMNQDKKTPVETGNEEYELDFGDVQFEDDNDDEDDENVISVEKLKKQYMPDPEPELNFDIASSHAPTPRPRTPEIPLQAPFMPSSTPQHLSPRYLCWNEVGIIRSYCSEDDGTKSIEVEFHDSSFHSSIMLQNYQEYYMGTVSKDALVLGNASQISVIPLSASSKEWVLKCEENEEIVLVTGSETLVCFATNNYLVRVCSIFGTQRAVVSIPGPLVSMAAYKNALLVAYHSGGIRKGDQCIDIKVIQFEGLTVKSKNIDSALGPETTLQWLGFTDAGSPALMDSSGMLSIYPSSSEIWIPFCNIRNHCKCLSDGFFVSAVFEMYLTVAGIKCKGSMYPGFTPRPVICELPLEPPFAEPAIERSQWEMNLFAWANLQVGDTEKKFKEIGLKTFALACRNDLDQRALEIMEILCHPQLLNLSIKYASKLDKKRLVEKLINLASEISESDHCSSVDQELSTPEVTTVKTFTKKLSLSIKKSTKPTSQTEEVNRPVLQENVDVTQSSNVANQSISNTTINPIKSVSLERRQNPFLKKPDKADDSHKNPLSLTDKYAGVDYSDAKDDKPKSNEGSEKRKNPESGTEKQREKQRKLDKFMFKKRS